jgi:putative sugar O-methyltransferase
MTHQDSTKDIEDQIELLDLMLEDSKHFPEIYQPTNYWSFYQNHIINHIRAEGLKTFRSSENEYLSTFGARDLHPIKAPITSLIALSRSEEEAKQYIEYLALAAKYPDVDLFPFDISLNDLNETAFRLTVAHGIICGAKPLSEITASLAGHPEYFFSVNGKSYTYAFLSAYWRYCFCCQYINFDDIDVIVELGMGTGKQAEVVKKLHPHITYYLIDLPPQAYLTGQFLKAIFGDVVMDYNVYRNQPMISSKPGSINILCNWQMESLKIDQKTLFWNAASFGEMEPHIVDHYLNIASRWSNYIYLHQCMKGKEQGKKGEGGVLKQTRFEDYHNFLQESYHLVSRASAYGALKKLSDSGGYEDTLFKKT